MKLTVTLFDSIINTSQDCVFWKDKNRRFMGVNRAFLDFYGFDSEDVLIGKTSRPLQSLWPNTLRASDWLGIKKYLLPFFLRHQRLAQPFAVSGLLVSHDQYPSLLIFGNP